MTKTCTYGKRRTHLKKDLHYEKRKNSTWAKHTKWRHSSTRRTRPRSPSRLELLAPHSRATRTCCRYICVYTKYACMGICIYMYINTYRLKKWALGSRATCSCLVYTCVYKICMYRYIHIHVTIYVYTCM